MRWLKAYRQTLPGDKDKKGRKGRRIRFQRSYFAFNVLRYSRFGSNGHKESVTTVIYRVQISTRQNRLRGCDAVFVNPVGHSQITITLVSAAHRYF
uniref:Uncharacterized protein n=1 Tax=Helianthus annuus TaxID=4232 RepID=A0A251U0D1_HELAN